MRSAAGPAETFAGLVITLDSGEGCVVKRLVNDVFHEVVW
jgi:hypothetical protein